MEIRNCSFCNEQVEINHKKRLNQENIFCNKKCEANFKRKEPNTRCSICAKPISVKPHRLKKTKNITCSKNCSNKIKETIYLGENNPNFKHEKNFDCLYNLTYDGAYILGFIFADGHISKKTYSIELSQNENYSGDLLKKISYLIFNKDNRVQRNEDLHTLSINSKELIKYILNLGGITEGKKSSILSMPHLPDDKMWSFICGFFDGDGGFKYNYKYPEINIASNSQHLLQSISNFWNVNYNNKDKIYASGFNALDICGKMYKNVSLYHEKKFLYFQDILNWEPSNINMCKFVPILRYQKLHPDAIIPFKKRVTDSGFDVSAMEMTYDEETDLYIANTNIAVEPPPGYYCDLIGRSSLPKSGFMFVGGVGIIDKSYTGPIKMMLKKINKNSMLPKLPFRCGQLILRKFVHPQIIEVNELSKTDRGSGGFGSTGK